MSVGSLQQVLGLDFKQSVIITKVNNTTHMEEALIGTVGCGNTNDGLLNSAIQLLSKQNELLVANVKDLNEAIREQKVNKSTNGILLINNRIEQENFNSSVPITFE